jgi:hypothetical protein
LIKRLLAVLRLAADGQGICVQEFAHAIPRNIVIVNE